MTLSIEGHVTRVTLSVVPLSNYVGNLFPQSRKRQQSASKMQFPARCLSTLSSVNRWTLSFEIGFLCVLPQCTLNVCKRLLIFIVSHKNVAVPCDVITSLEIWMHFYNFYISGNRNE